MVNSINFIKRLQLILSHYQLSAAALADTIEVQRSSISHLLSGRNKPSLEFVLKLIKKFPEVHIYWLINGEGDFPNKGGSLPPIPEDLKIEKTTLNEKKLSPLEASSKIPAQNEIQARENHQEDVDQIIIFYKNGHFKIYTP